MTSVKFLEAVWGGGGYWYMNSCIDFAELWYFFSCHKRKILDNASFYELLLDLEDTMQGMREFAIHFDSSKL